ncbi:MAG: hypothetical protein EOS54_03985 [Mesorhizobium sp.]|uniref:hypothetical protein n=2 Tax=Mesorhizobium TaxID=68287 RepID=UPI000FD3D014|nr:hypothetical protein [Mesorhizobium sp.]RVC81768.1 hypothetical protein EN766_02550 [Mesorhizobium sp. M2A.F.Ca.ET.046.02.1.1]RWB42771.1 MAG: hypothetical protein EOQ44_20310 [Mesorhizobium sp.]RWC57901.1 MAG: hypothetical protein EOS54_03985 [Mesorhizobium sp.]RWE22011.1 MAG: hypothetical protein EOS76_02870 [Mesorhizobium sp.]
MIICAGLVGAVMLVLKPGAALSLRDLITVSDAQPLSPSAEVAQSDENEEEENQVVPGVSPIFMEKLSAITESSSTPDQKLAEITALVQSYGWPSTPPAIQQVVNAARDKIFVEKANAAEGEGATTTGPDIPTATSAPVSEREAEQAGIFFQFSLRFYVAKYCADHDAFFTSDEVDRLQATLKETFATMDLSQQRKDEIWKTIQERAPAQLSDMTEGECATEKRAYALLWPQVFGPSDPVQNPF